MQQMVSYSPRCKAGALLPEFPTVADVKLMPADMCEVKVSSNTSPTARHDVPNDNAHILMFAVASDKYKICRDHESKVTRLRSSSVSFCYSNWTDLLTCLPFLRHLHCSLHLFFFQLACFMTIISVGIWTDLSLCLTLDIIVIPTTQRMQ